MYNRETRVEERGSGLVSRKVLAVMVKGVIVNVQVS